MPSSIPARLRRALPRVRLTRRRVIAGSAVLVLLVGLVGWAAWPTPAGYRTEDRMIAVKSGPNGDQDITLDTRLYLPTSADARNRVPAVLLAHGFGGTKLDSATDAQDLANHGYAVLTWTAQGFGRSTGQIHLDSPDWEVKDAKSLVDWLAARPEIRQDGAGDPRVAAIGGSYGGGLSLLLAAYDQRVDAIVPMITWNDLARAFLPDAAGGSPENGVFKKQWAGLFFGSGGSLGAGPGAGLAGLGGAPDAGQTSGGPNPGASQGAGGRNRGTPPAAGPSAAPGGSAGRNALGQVAADPPAARAQCGRFALDVCQAYLEMATAGRPGPAGLDLLRRSSPASVIDKIKAPTLLIQGEADSLFPLSEADANAKGIAANGTPVRVAWFTGGHDGGQGPQSDQDRNKFLTAQWLDHYLAGKGSKPQNSFTYSRISGIDASGEGLVAAGFTVTDYPGTTGTKSEQISVSGPPQAAANPPNGNPAAISSLAGAGGATSLVSGLSTEVPGQHADFYSAPLTKATDVTGSPTVQIKAASPTGEAVLFVKLYDVDANGQPTLPNGLIAPIRLTGLPAGIDQATPTTVTLPAIVRRFEDGHRIRITVSASDQAYTTPAEPTVYTIAAGGPVTLPMAPGTPIQNPSVIWRYVLFGLIAVIAVALVVVTALSRRRLRRREKTEDGYAQTPLVVRGLRKEYADGFVAVSRVDFTVERDTVVGLLGPNGAGKTTTLRVLMGLTYPTHGEILVFGQRLRPGAPVLSRVGALVEGPGFLPHLSGYTNLQLYWKSTGRPEAEARFEEALDIAGLGTAVHRKVKTYSHGMKQRLAIAQAMLGLPELLVLDEPTDGLDPPQIAEMRKVLRRYATDGRAVLVSSHLLAEVEQTCTDVVVMHRGEIVASGLVDDIVGDSPSVQLDVSDVDEAENVLDKLGVVRSVAWSGGNGLVVDLDGTPRSEVVAALVKAGIGVDRVVPRRRLEDAFLALVGGDTKASGER
ncbi:alpha/beta fold hydrolase [Planosporangium mesophilum]|uniref:ABC transporter ATP-binding protein n=1 Tax=Planosporangium mesophilum TaxID=689768 RepID=A0A8J3TK24_9ACTN|nr:alpha/beta fold hydrolase [Planosporangium mesophilum]NJC83749.1 alpha/beta fold hydrolase [Planosporangium mesophilum]GII26069.1 ABC transporter ATP-binding protein [Planosporangium mesophilum]